MTPLPFKKLAELQACVACTLCGFVFQGAEINVCPACSLYELSMKLKHCLDDRSRDIDMATRSLRQKVAEALVLLQGCDDLQSGGASAARCVRLIAILRD